MKSEEDIWVPQNTINISCLEIFQGLGRGVIKKNMKFVSVTGLF
jgi:hypothetical protein